VQRHTGEQDQASSNEQTAGVTANGANYTGKANLTSG
jgi:hypothetical protein